MIDLSTLSNLTDAILEAFDYARKTDIPLIIKNTGHDWKGRSSAPGSLALWTHKLQTPNVPMILHQNFQPSNCTTYPEEIVVEVGAGEQWGNIYEFAQKNGLAVLGGTCPSVGIAGWLSGGGHSPLTPVFGMGVDNVRQVELATPRGDILIATECQNEDLFFAVRGGGGGTFGVITKIWYQTIEKFELQVGHMANSRKLSLLKEA